MVPLTPRQREALEWIVFWRRVTGKSPSVRELAREMQLSASSSAHQYIVALERKGYVRRVQTRAGSSIVVLHS